MHKRRKEKDYGEEACTDKAGRILGRRLHSSFELRKKLLSNGYPEKVVENTISKLLSLHFLDDARFADAYARELMEKGCGPRKIMLELAKRGIPKEIISEQVANLANLSDENANPQDEKNSAIKIAIQKKMRSLSRESDPRKKKEKLYRHLLSKGFLPEQIIAEI